MSPKDIFSRSPPRVEKEELACPGCLEHEDRVKHAKCRLGPPNAQIETLNRSPTVRIVCRPAYEHRLVVRKGKRRRSQVRKLRYPGGRGHPTNAVRAERRDLEEWVMLAQAAISIANTERRVLDRDAPPTVEGQVSKGASYEVTVVDRFYQLAQRSFASRGLGAVWERRFPTGQRGRPKSIDISLFGPSCPGSDVSVETRIEFGLYSSDKLRDDAVKLHELRKEVTEGYHEIRNLLILWEEDGGRMTANTLQDRLSRMKRDCTAISSPAVSLVMVSGVDLFSESEDAHRVAYVGLFRVC